MDKCIEDKLIELCTFFFYEGMTYEQFGRGKGNGLYKINKNISPNEYLISKLKEKELL